MPNPKAYIGDAVYVEFNGYAFVLTTSNGHHVTNTIFMEPETLAGLDVFRESIRWRNRKTLHNRKGNE